MSVFVSVLTCFHKTLHKPLKCYKYRNRVKKKVYILTNMETIFLHLKNKHYAKNKYTVNY